MSGTSGQSNATGNGVEEPARTSSPLPRQQTDYEELDIHFIDNRHPSDPTTPSTPVLVNMDVDVFTEWLAERMPPSFADNKEALRQVLSTHSSELQILKKVDNSRIPEQRQPTPGLDFGYAVPKRNTSVDLPPTRSPSPIRQRTPTRGDPHGIRHLMSGPMRNMNFDGCEEYRFEGKKSVIFRNPSRVTKRSPPPRLTRNPFKRNLMANMNLSGCTVFIPDPSETGSGDGYSESGDSDGWAFLMNRARSTIDNIAAQNPDAGAAHAPSIADNTVRDEDSCNGDQYQGAVPSTETKPRVEQQSHASIRATSEDTLSGDQYVYSTIDTSRVAQWVRTTNPDTLPDAIRFYGRRSSYLNFEPTLENNVPVDQQEQSRPFLASLEIIEKPSSSTMAAANDVLSDQQNQAIGSSTLGDDIDTSSPMERRVQGEDTCPYEEQASPPNSTSTITNPLQVEQQAQASPSPLLTPTTLAADSPADASTPPPTDQPVPQVQIDKIPIASLLAHRPHTNLSTGPPCPGRSPLTGFRKYLSLQMRIPQAASHSRLRFGYAFADEDVYYALLSNPEFTAWRESCEHDGSLDDVDMLLVWLNMLSEDETRELHEDMLAEEVFSCVDFRDMGWPMPGDEVRRAVKRGRDEDEEGEGEEVQFLFARPIKRARGEERT